MNLRPYQEECCAKVEDGWNEYTKQLVVIPTGGGKTIVFSAMAARNPERTLIIAHREELIQQAKEKLERSTGLRAEIERADERASLDARVVVASAQTLVRRFSRFPQDHFSLVIVDEAHHIMAPTYQAPLNHFLLGGANVLGVTATPNTKGKKALGHFFEDIAFEIGLLDLIRQGYLSSFVIKSFPLHLDLPLELSGADYDAEAIDAALTPFLESIVTRLPQEVGDRKTLVFLPLVKTVHRFVELCRQHGLTAEAVWGECPEREHVLAGHGTRFQYLANSMLLTEGYDDPSIECIFPLRPTRSEILLSQMVGRGTRIYCPWGCVTQKCKHNARKKGMLLLDPLWLHADLSLVRPASLVTSNEDDAKSITQRVDEAQEEIDLLLALEEAEHDREKSLAEKLKTLGKRKGRLMSIEELAVKVHIPDLAEFQGTMKWHDKPPTPKQIECLTGAGIDGEAVKSRGHAKKLIDEVFKRRELKLCTFKQMRMLERFHIAEPEKISFIDASRLLDKLMKERTTA